MVEKIPLSELDFNLQTDQFYKYRIEFEDNRFRGYLEDKQLFDVTDDTYTSAGNLGVHCGSLTAYRNVRYREI